MPAIVEADDLGLYVVKFRGAGQGLPVLVAELLAGEIGRALGLPVPEIVLIDIDPDLARTEPDGSYVLELPYSEDRELVMDILRYGPDVEVIGPASLRGSLKKALQSALKHYN